MSTFRRIPFITTMCLHTLSRAEIFKSLFNIQHHYPIIPPVLSGPPGAPTVVSASKTCINLTWTPPVDDRGVPIIGYQLEKRKKDMPQWIALNTLNEPIRGRPIHWLNVLAPRPLADFYFHLHFLKTLIQSHFFLGSYSICTFIFCPPPSAVSYAVKDVTEGAEYEFRVTAINESGAGDPSPPSAMVCAKNPNSKFISNFQRVEPGQPEHWG